MTLYIFSNTKIFFFEKTSKISKYLVRIFTFLAKSKTIQALLTGYITIIARKVIYITKFSMFSFNATLANSFVLMIFIYLVISRALAVI